jgi:hypothetical protein
MPISLPPLEEYANIATSTGRVCQYRYLHWKSIPISISPLEEYVNVSVHVHWNLVKPQVYTEHPSAHYFAPKPSNLLEFNPQDIAS